MKEIALICIGAIADFFAPDDIDEEQPYENIAKDTWTVWTCCGQGKKQSRLS